MTEEMTAQFTPLNPDLVRAIDAGPARLDPASRVFANSDLDMRSIKWVGFDMDYTLAIYKKEPMEQLQYDLTLRRLVERLGYPKEILTLQYDPAFIIRGLTVDKRTGWLVKMDSQGRVTRCFRGRSAVDTDKYEPLYRNIGSKVSSNDYASLDTLFAMPEACLFANLMDFFTARHETKASLEPLNLHPDHETRNLGPLDTFKLFDDVRQSIDSIHRDGSLKADIMSDLQKYIVVDKDLPLTLHKLRSSGKRLFVLTNSYWTYTNTVMSYLLDGQLKEYANWRGYFDVVLVGGRKPGFFGEREPFLEVARGDEDIDPGEISTAETFERTSVYQGGNMADFEKRVGAFGQEILYVGDHIFGDILRSKKDSGWRTCMIVEELAREIHCVESAKTKVDELALIDENRHMTADRIAEQRAILEQLERVMHEGSAVSEEAAAAHKVLKKELDVAKRLPRSMDDKVHQLHDEIDATFNPYWGRLLKTRNELSRFGGQVRRYADIYTAKVSNFLQVSPMHLYRAPRDLMTHDYVLADSRGLTNVRRPEHHEI